jgi:hypothetical protein
MGAHKENRDQQHLRDSLDDEYKRDPHRVCKDAEYQLQHALDTATTELAALRSVREELRRAKMLIDRQRAKIVVLETERRNIIHTIDRCKKHISISGNLSRIFAVGIVKSQLLKARLI